MAAPDPKPPLITRIFELCQQLQSDLISDFYRALLPNPIPFYNFAYLDHCLSVFREIRAIISRSTLGPNGSPDLINHYFDSLHILDEMIGCIDEILFIFRLTNRNG